jgi:predicted lipid carrier protein YhbT
VASADECREALHRLAAQLEAKAANVDLDRSLACRVTDLDTAFHGRLTGGRLVGIADGDDPKAKIKITASSDDLVALLDGRLDVGKAVASRRVVLSANPFDLLKLRKLL